MAQMHWMITSLLGDIRGYEEHDEKFAAWERGFIRGQISMLRYVKDIPAWQRVYVENLYHAKMVEHFTGV